MMCFRVVHGVVQYRIADETKVITDWTVLEPTFSPSLQLSYFLAREGYRGPK